MNQNIESFFDETIEVLSKLKTDKNLIDAINLIFLTLEKGNKLLICGNGGSAADSQHFAAELVGRYKKERKSLPAIALTTDSSILTAIGNDYGYDEVFSRQIESLANKGDVLISISTSGNSPNLIKAITKAKEKDLKSISLLGKSGGQMKDISDIAIIVPSENTPKIQESHITMIHIICEIVENKLFKNG